MLSKTARLGFVLIALVLSCAVCAGFAAPAAAPAVFEFPKDKPIGVLFPLAKGFQRLPDIGSAIGSVRGDPKEINVFKPNPLDSSNPRYWDKVPANIEGLELLGLDFDNTLVATLAKRFKNLRYLGIADSDVDDHVFDILPQFKKLKAIDMRGTSINGSGFANLAQMPALEELQLQGCTVRPENLKHLVKDPNLKFIRLSETAIGDSACKYLGQLPKLDVLILSRTLVTNKGLADLVPLKDTLTLLDLAGCDITDEGFKSIGKLDHLSHLNVRTQRYPGFTAKGVQQLRGLKNLTYLDFANSKRIKDDVVIAAAKYCPNLIAFYLAESPLLSDKGFVALVALKNLSSLFVSETAAGNGVLDTAAKMPQLVYLEMSSAKIDDAGLKRYCSKPRNMSALAIANTKITDAGLTNIGNLSKLKIITLNGDNISDASIPYLSKLKNLEGIGAMNTKITDKGFAQLHRVLPKLRILR